MTWQDDTLARLERARTADANYENEKALQADLAAWFERRDWKVIREVWCDGPGGTGKVDLYVRPPARWVHAERIPAIAIEAKLNRDFGTHLVECIGKLRDVYIPATTWLPPGKRRWVTLTRPAIVLYATPVSVALGRGIYDWRDEATRKWVKSAVDHLAGPGDDPALEAAVDLALIAGIGMVVERVLWKHGGAVLRGDGFVSNSKAIAPAQDGAARFYDFRDVRKVAA